MMFNPTNLGEGFVSIDQIIEEHQSTGKWFSKTWGDLMARRAARDTILDIASDLAAEAEGWWEAFDLGNGRVKLWHPPIAEQQAKCDLTHEEESLLMKALFASSTSVTPIPPIADADAVT